MTGILLAGGNSKRMGTNKAFLKLNGLLVIEIIAQLLKRHFGKVVLISNELELYKFLQLETYEDIYKGMGPLGGIFSGLTYSTTEKNFIISCDVPLISYEIIEFIAGFPTNKNIVVPYADGHIQQLCGVYTKSCLPLIKDILNESYIQTNGNKCMVLRLIERSNTCIIDIEKEMQGYKLNSFLNMNDIVQFRKVESIFEERFNNHK